MVCLYVITAVFGVPHSINLECSFNPELLKTVNLFTAVGFDMKSLLLPSAGKTGSHECFISCSQRVECVPLCSQAPEPTQAEASQQSLKS